MAGALVTFRMTGALVRVTFGMAGALVTFGIAGALSRWEEPLNEDRGTPDGFFFFGVETAGPAAVLRGTPTGSKSTWLSKAAGGERGTPLGVVSGSDGTAGLDGKGGSDNGTPT